VYTFANYNGEPRDIPNIYLIRQDNRTNVNVEACNDSTSKYQSIWVIKKKLNWRLLCMDLIFTSNYQRKWHIWGFGKGIHFPSVSIIFQLDYGTIPILWQFFFFIWLLQQYFSYIVPISYICGGNRSTWRKPPIFIFIIK
jgi:hypothetical protein